MASSSSNAMLKFVGQNYCENGISILLVSHSLAVQKLHEALLQNEPKSTVLKVSITQTIQQLLQQDKESSFDFIVFIISAGQSESLKHLKTDVFLMDKHYLAMSRVCLVLLKDVRHSQMQVNIDDVHAAAAMFHTPLIISSLQGENDYQHLAKQIMNLVSTVTGAISGVPLIVTQTQQETDWLLSDLTSVS